MAQYDVYPNPSPNPHSRRAVPFVVDVQSGLLSGLRTRLVMPLSRVGAGAPGLPRRLIPLFTIDGERLALHAHQSNSVEARSLKSPVGTLAASAGEIRDALDAVVSGI